MSGADCLTLLLALWEASFLNPVPIAVKPLQVAMGQKPLESSNGEAVEGKAHGLAHAHEAIECSHFGQHMGGVSSLALALLEPALFFKDS
jgi:hypothetical protein